MRWFLSQTAVKWFKQIGILGWIRFRIVRLGYKLFWWNSPRNGEWDFVLQWLEPLRKFQGDIKVLDVGSTESLLIYELLHRGYRVLGIDQRPYQEKNPYTMIFDVVTNDNISYLGSFDYIIAISSVEHIGLNAYEDGYNSMHGDRVAMENLHKILKHNGFFIITLPNKHLGTDTGRGYSYRDFQELIKGLFEIIHYEERNNQICAVLCQL